MSRLREPFVSPFMSPESSRQREARWAIVNIEQIAQELDCSGARRVLALVSKNADAGGWLRVPVIQHLLNGHQAYSISRS